MILRIRGVQVIKKPSGKVFYYHRATGTRITAPPHTAAFAAEVAEIEAKAKATQQKPMDRKLEGTWGWLVTYWRSAPEWENLSPRTKSDYLRVLDYLANLDPVPLERFTPAEIIEIRNKAFKKHKRRFSNYVLAVISRAWNVGLGAGKTPHANPVSKEQKVKRPRNAPVVNRPWTTGEITMVFEEASHPIRIACALALWAGWREGDVCRMKVVAYNGKEIEGRQGKTGDLVWMPAHSALRAALDEELERLPRLKDAPLVINLRGRAYTESGFRASFFKLIGVLEKAGKVNPGLTYHGLRVTMATLIADGGGDTRAIAAALGHATEAMAQHYARHAERKRAAARAIAILEAPEKESG